MPDGFEAVAGLGGRLIAFRWGNALRWFPPWDGGKQRPVHTPFPWLPSAGRCCWACACQDTGSPRFPIGGKYRSPFSTPNIPLFQRNETSRFYTD